MNDFPSNHFQYHIHLTLKKQKQKNKKINNYGVDDGFYFAQKENWKFPLLSYLRQALNWVILQIQSILNERKKGIISRSFNSIRRCLVQ